MTRHARGRPLATFVVALVVVSVTAITSAQASPRVSSAKEFDVPSGLAIAGGHLWVTNESGNSVTEINPLNGKWVASIERSGGYDFVRPDAITQFGPDLFVANADSITEMASSNGKFVRLIEGAAYHFANPVALALAGETLLVLNAGASTAPTPVLGSITEINATTGAFIRTIAGPSYRFDDPVGLAVFGSDVFVVDEASSSLTEVNLVGGALEGVITNEGLDAPDGIALEDGYVWVANSANNSLTQVSAASDAVVANFNDNEGNYGFAEPSTMIATRGNVYVATPFGSSPKVTKVAATSGAPAWYMGDASGPYNFFEISAFAVSGNDLWVASRTGATHSTVTGSLTEMLITTGALVKTVPASPTPPTTTSTSTTTTTTTTLPS